MYAFFPTSQRISPENRLWKGGSKGVLMLLPADPVAGRVVGEIEALIILIRQADQSKGVANDASGVRELQRNLRQWWHICRKSEQQKYNDSSNYNNLSGHLYSSNLQKLL